MTITNFSLFLHVYFSYTPVMFSNQTDPTGKFMNLVIAQCVITQVRYIFSRHMVFKVVACLLCSIYILVSFESSRAYYNCQFRTWMFLTVPDLPLCLCLLKHRAPLARGGCILYLLSYRFYEQHSGKLFCYILVSYAVGMYFILAVQN